MTAQFWTNNPTILLNKNYIFDLWPTYNMEFEEINPMSEISFTPHNNNSVISGKRDCSVQTDNMFINKKINTQNMKDNEKNSMSEQHRLLNPIKKNNKTVNNLNFLFKRFPRRKISRPLTI